MNFNDIFKFPFETDMKQVDLASLLKVNQKMVLNVLRWRDGENKEVIGTKLVEWRYVLAGGSIELNVEIVPSELTHHGTLGLVKLLLDFVPSLKQREGLQGD